MIARRAALLLAAVAAVLCAAAPPALADYALDLRLSRDGRTLSGTERITFANETSAPMETVWLRTWAYGQGGCRSRGVSISVIAGGSERRRATGCTALEVRLAAPLAPGASGALDLRLRLRAPRRMNRFGTSRGIALYGNTIPVLAVGDVTRPFSQVGESWVSRAAPWKAAIAVPRGLRVATTGSGRKSGGVLRVRSAAARDFMVAASRSMRAVRGRQGGVRITFWRSRRTTPRRARAAVRHAATAIRRFGAAWGPYGAPELELVDSNIAMEYPELVLTPATGFVVSHEVAHQWWWGIVGNDQYVHPWLDESLASYAEVRGVPGLRFPRDCRVPPAGVAGRSMAWWDAHRDDYGRDVYFGGMCALVRLEQAWSRAGLDAALRAYVAANRFGIGTPDALFAALRDAGAPPDALAAFERVFTAA